MEKHRIIAIEGTDGSGKTTASVAVANQMGGIYSSWRDGRLSKLSSSFACATPFVRFIYYVSVATETAIRASILARQAEAFMDRTMASTKAYHRAMGVPARWMTLIPPFTLNQIDTMLYFNASDSVRLARLQERLCTTSMGDQVNDRFSLEHSERLHNAYMEVMPNRTSVIDTTELSIKETIARVRSVLYGNSHITT